jgi:hypothetical protein
LGQACADLNKIALLAPIYGKHDIHVRALRAELSLNRLFAALGAKRLPRVGDSLSAQRSLSDHHFMPDKENSMAVIENTYRPDARFRIFREIMLWQSEAQRLPDADAAMEQAVRLAERLFEESPAPHP